MMFEGRIGKEIMIEQGYVPPTCTMNDRVAGPTIHAEVSAGRSPCWGCNADRAVCKGQAKRESDANWTDRLKLLKRQAAVQRAALEQYTAAKAAGGEE